MTRFIQLHMLTSYPPSNLNRDDLGRPKTAIVGGRNRLRISSQSLKRAWRCSDTFSAAMKGHVGTRTKRLGADAAETLRTQGIPDKDASDWGRLIADVFGKSRDDLMTEQLVHVSPEEQQGLDSLVAKLAQRRNKPSSEELLLLRKESTAVDIAMFGRMLASDPDFNVDAAVQVAHAFTVHPVTVEEDYYTAVDDRKQREDDMGAGHVGVNEFGAGVFYHYVCVSRDQLQRNLGGDAALARRALAALVETMTTTPPSGKQNSFASRSFASFMLAERGDRQPRSLAVSFLDGPDAPPYLSQSVMRLDGLLERLDRVYGKGEERERFDVDKGEGSLAALQKFVTE